MALGAEVRRGGRYLGGKKEKFDERRGIRTPAGKAHEKPHFMKVKKQNA